MSTNSACEISIGPELASPQLFFHLWATPEYFTSCQTFYHCHQIRHTVTGNRLDQKVNMVFIRANLQKFYLVSLFDFQTNIPQFLIHLLINDGTTVLGWKDQMVNQYSHIVTFMEIFAHIPILRRKRRGIQPQGIKRILIDYKGKKMKTESYNSCRNQHTYGFCRVVQCLVSPLRMRRLRSVILWMMRFISAGKRSSTRSNVSWLADNPTPLK